ncbi:MAG: type II secretion system protein GspC [bacterium]|nr:type II secretion system protein GspC [bacterium]
MEPIRNYRFLFTFADVALLVLAALFASRVVSAILVSPSEPARPAAVSGVQDAAGARIAPPTDTGAILGKNLFGSRIDGSSRSPVDISDDDLEKLPESTLPLKLLGTVVQVEGKRSFAVIQDTGTRQQQLYFAGEEIQEGVELASVSRNRVVLVRNGQEEILERAEDGVPSPPARQAAARSRRQRPSPAGDTASGDISVRKMGDNSYVMDRREVEGVLQDFNKLLTQIRVVPHFADGKPDGFKVFNIRPGSLFAQLGMVNGDIIKRVNGLDITGPEQALQMFTQLRDESSVAVDLERFRKNITLQYDIR